MKSKKNKQNKPPLQQVMTTVVEANMLIRMVRVRLKVALTESTTYLVGLTTIVQKMSSLGSKQPQKLRLPDIEHPSVSPKKRQISKNEVRRFF
ncbi:hypothetical protein PCORN_12662 [Listeria cornellensis FSL F6-0969]|uniref:Uncharacterized protein n=1 Tax=Listeria cornellensis FSL F6-0969 TaxID=1265820 RepID=W7BQ27_9LIST|nr:hypothetical protein PCORN_12662 [Listeria cornellensis FSL F6-0969]